MSQSWAKQERATLSEIARRAEETDDPQLRVLVTHLRVSHTARCRLRQAFRQTEKLRYRAVVVTRTVYVTSTATSHRTDSLLDRLLRMLGWKKD